MEALDRELLLEVPSLENCEKLLERGMQFEAIYCYQYISNIEDAKVVTVNNVISKKHGNFNNWTIIPAPSMRQLIEKLDYAAFNFPRIYILDEINKLRTANELATYILNKKHDLFER